MKYKQAYLDACNFIEHLQRDNRRLKQLVAIAIIEKKQLGFIQAGEEE